MPARPPAEQPAAALLAPGYACNDTLLCLSTAVQGRTCGGPLGEEGTDAGGARLGWDCAQGGGGAEQLVPPVVGRGRGAALALCSSLTSERFGGAGAGGEAAVGEGWGRSVGSARWARVARSLSASFYFN